MRLIADADQSESPRHRRWLWAALWLALLTGMAGVVWRGAGRGYQHSADFAVIYAAARTQVQGGNPYDYPTVSAVFLEAGGERDYLPDPKDRPAVYPPPTYLVLAPVALLDWSTARVVWLSINFAAMVAVIWLVIRMAGFDWDARESLAVAAGLMLLAPTQTAIAHGQLALPVLALMLVGVVFRKQWASLAGGVALGLAFALKPQLALPAIVWLVATKHKRVPIVAGIVWVLLLVAALAVLAGGGDGWFADLTENIRTVTAGGNADPTDANPHRHQLLELAYPLAAVGMTRTVAGGVASLVAFILLIVWLVGTRRRLSRDRLNLLTLAGVCLIGLIGIHHRTYDAVLLILPLAWAIREIGRGRHVWPVWTTVALTALFAFPTPAALYVWADRGHVPAWLVESFLWETLILPHQAWALLALTIILAWTIWHGGGRGIQLARRQND